MDRASAEQWARIIGAITGMTPEVTSDQSGFQIDRSALSDHEQREVQRLLGTGMPEASIIAGYRLILKQRGS